MHPATIELMREQVRTIYRAVTGADMPEPEALPSMSDVGVDDVARRFVDLEAMARNIPAVVERVPPFSFTPPVDLIDHEQELLIEVAVSGVDQADVTVERIDDMIVISGIRRGRRAAKGCNYLHAEIPWGPFYRAVRLPYALSSEPRAEVDRGYIRIYLAKKPASPAAK